MTNYVKQTWTDGSSAVSASRMGVIEQGVFDAHFQPAARVNHNTTQSISSGSTTTLAFNSERFDTDTIHDTVTNNSRLTCKTAGKYLVNGQIQWASAPAGVTDIRVNLNGSTPIAIVQVLAIDARIMNVTTMYDLSVNDYVELQVTQTSGGAINILSANNFSPEFMMVRVA